MSATSSTRVSIDSLIREFEESFPKNMGQDKWYLTLTSAMVASGLGPSMGSLYQYLISQPQHQTPEQRQRLIRRIREALMKCIILVGIPAVLEAVASITQVEKVEDKDYSFSRQGWQPDTTHGRGMSVLNFLYRDDYPRIMATFEAHKDIAWASETISYGMFLSDAQTLNLQEMELIILPAVMCQNLRGPAMWHFRGCLRAGVAHEDLLAVRRAVELVAAHAGRSLDRIGGLEEVRDDMAALIH